MKWLKRTGWLALALLVIVVLAGWWLVGSESGMRMVLARAEAALGGQLTAASASGQLAGPLELHGVRWSGPQADVRVDTLRLDPGLMALFGVRGRIDVLEAEGIDVLLHPVEQEEPETDQPTRLDLAPPLDLILERARLSDITVRKADNTLFEADSISLAGSWTDRGIHVVTLDVRSPHGYVSLQGELAQAENLVGTGKLQFDWRRGDMRVAGELNSEANGERMLAKLKLTAPLAASIEAKLGQSASAPWQATLTAPQFDPTSLLGESKIKRLGLKLDAHGDIDSASAQGRITINQHPLVVQDLALAWGGERIEVTSLALRQGTGPGAFDAHGTVHTQAEPIALELAANWHDVVLPADLVGQNLRTRGAITVGGTLDDWRAQGELALGPPDQLTDFNLDLAGNPDRITLNKVELVQAKGHLAVTGSVQTAAPLRWNIEASAENFDPGALVAGWNGSVDLALASAGQLGDQGPSGSLVLTSLTGSLRQRPISGSADLELQPGWLLSGNLALRSGTSRIDFDGKPGQRIDARIDLAIDSLADWLPDASGQVDGRLYLVGNWPDMALNGQIKAGELSFGENSIAATNLALDLDSVWPLAGSANLVANQLTLGGLRFDKLRLDAGGDSASHQLELAAEGADLDLQLGIRGSQSEPRWHGKITEFSLEPAGLPAWKLANPAAWSLIDGAFELESVCLDAGQPHLCLAGSRQANGSASAQYELEQFPLSVLRLFAAPEAALRVNGTLDGEGKVSVDANGNILGQATLSSQSGDIRLDRDTAEALIGWKDLALQASLDGNNGQVTANAQLSRGGQLAGTLQIAGPEQRLAGQLKVVIADLGVLELVTDQVAAVEGSAEGNYRIGGTLASPEVSGAMKLENFTAEIPRIGIQLANGSFSVRSTAVDRFALEGHVESGEGALNISGEGGFAADAPLSVSLVGDEFLAADIPAAHVVVSPDLELARSQHGYLLTGTLKIPRARVDLSKLPGGGAPVESTDVVIVDAEKSPESESLALRADITVSLGEEVKLTGFGLDGAITGSLAIHEQPGEPTKASGELRVSGTYQAYGQDLKIQRGSLLFANSPIDNPGLGIRATREIREQDVTVGIEVSGTAARPSLSVFSDPAMEQSEALSYLVTGRPLSALKSGEGDMLQSAATALGTAAGDRLAKGLGSKLGVDDIGVSNNAAVGGAAFSVGKYLSPSLYLNYGVGLFTPGEVITLRYIMSQRWNLEVESATEFNRAGLNYRYEK